MRRPEAAFLLLLVVVVTGAFAYLIRAFLIPLVLAAAFAGLAHPLYERLERRLGGRRGPAALLTLAILLVGVGVPLAAFGGLVVQQALKVSEAAGPWAEQTVGDRRELFAFFQRLPGYESLRPFWGEIVSRLGSMAGNLGKLAFSRLSSLTAWTLKAMVDAGILFYAMYFFLVDGRAILRRVLYLMPLSHGDELRLAERFRSMAKATLKGTLVIGVVQASAAGAALGLAGVPSALFWSTLMIGASLIPTFGTGLVWIPAALYLFIQGETAKGAAVLAWCSVVVASADNLLRPVLVGKEAQVPELLVLLSTLGGLMAFGLSGVLLGPILAVMFLTVWDIYGAAFKRALPEVGKL